MELIAHGTGGVPWKWVDAYSRDGYDPRKWRKVSFSGEPLSPEAEVALYREFDVTDDPLPGILGERHDSTRDLRWLQNSASYYDRAFRRALERLRDVRTPPPPLQPRTTTPERPVQGRTLPSAPRVSPLATPPNTPCSAPKSVPPPAPRPAPPPAPRPAASTAAPSPPVLAQHEPPNDELPSPESVYEEAHKLGFKGTWSPLVRWMFAWVLCGSGYLSWLFVLIVKLVAVFFDESTGVLIAWATFVWIQYLFLACVVDRLAPAAYRLPLPFFRI